VAREIIDALNAPKALHVSRSQAYPLTFGVASAN